MPKPKHFKRRKGDRSAAVEVKPISFTMEGDEDFTYQVIIPQNAGGQQMLLMMASELAVVDDQEAIKLVLQFINLMLSPESKARVMQRLRNEPDFDLVDLMDPIEYAIKQAAGFPTGKPSGSLTGRPKGGTTSTESSSRKDAT